MCGSAVRGESACRKYKPIRCNKGLLPMKPANIFEYVAARVIEHMRYRDDELAKVNEKLRIVQSMSDIYQCSQCNDYDHTNQCVDCSLQYCNGCMITDTIIDRCNNCIIYGCYKCKSRACVTCIECKISLCYTHSNLIKSNNIFKCTRWHYD